VPERLQGQATQLQAQEIELEQTDQERKQEQVVQREAEVSSRPDSEQHYSGRSTPPASSLFVRQ
jgi:hypothetical protein